MKNILILGAGTTGTIMANHLRKRVDRSEWKITIVDQEATHHYQPGYLFLPFGDYRPEEIVKPKKKFIPEGVEMIMGEIDRVDADDSKVFLADDT